MTSYLALVPSGSKFRCVGCTQDPAKSFNYPTACVFQDEATRKIYRFKDETKELVEVKPVSAHEELLARINAAVGRADVAAGKKGTIRILRKALSEIRWVLKVAESSVDVYCRLNDQGDCDLTDDLSLAQVFDGRDNEAMKLAYWSLQVNEDLEICLL